MSSLGLPVEVRRVLAKTSPVCSLKAAGQGRFNGLAWSFAHTPDREGDIILPSAFEGAIEAHKRAGTQPQVQIEHEPSLVAGAITSMDLSDRGLVVEGQLNLQNGVGRAAYEKLESGDMAALSIGMDALFQKSGRTRIIVSGDLLEVSLCRYPMNAGARIEAVKSWRDVNTQRDLERLLSDIAGMPNRLARKTATAAWPVIESQSKSEDELHAALQRIIGA